MRPGRILLLLSWMGGGLCACTEGPSPAFPGAFDASPAVDASPATDAFGSRDDGGGGDAGEWCGDGVVNASEVCDVAIPDGEQGACPKSCESQDPCQQASVGGHGCMAHCEVVAAPCRNTDGCCPASCSAATDDDCPPVLTLRRWPGNPSVELDATFEVGSDSAVEFRYTRDTLSFGEWSNEKTFTFTNLPIAHHLFRAQARDARGRMSNEVTFAWEVAPVLWETSDGWGAPTNYFDKWHCSSAVGINNVRRLNIIPHGTHDGRLWKDSLFVNVLDRDGANPIIWFTIGLHDLEPVFTLAKATYDQQLGHWQVEKFLDHPTNAGGVSSQDGYADHYVMNEYYIPGWGPTANVRGSVSKIPAVAEQSTTVGFPSYPLWGTGPLGLSTIRELKRDPDYPDPNVQTCLHMNPTLFDYDASGVPRAFAAELWTKARVNSQQVALPCLLPEGAPVSELPYIGFWTYRYVDDQLGWQLDLNAGMIETPHIANTAFNYVYGSERKFIRADWSGKLIRVDLTQPLALQKKVLLDCRGTTGADGGLQAVNFAEASGDETAVYFLGDEYPYRGSAAGLHERTSIHDIFVAFKTQ
ncbi:MAG: hypothetical protein HY901_29160 [Deltaproteobacteria bacterium]|nr:hypothetical protein [Deltaproteobacteria bacterium]